MMGASAHRLWQGGAGLVLLLALTGCARFDIEQARLCERVIPGIEGTDARIEVVRSEADPSAAHGVIVHYRVTGPEGQAAERWLACRFGGGGFQRDRLKLTGLRPTRRASSRTSRSTCSGSIGSASTSPRLRPRPARIAARPGPCAT